MEILELANEAQKCSELFGDFLPVAVVDPDRRSVTVEKLVRARGRIEMQIGGSLTIEAEEDARAEAVGTVLDRLCSREVTAELVRLLNAAEPDTPAREVIGDFLCSDWLEARLRG